LFSRRMAVIIGGLQKRLAPSVAGEQLMARSLLTFVSLIERTTICHTITQQLATMLSTAWRMSRALKCSFQGTCHARLYSFHQASRSWYKNLDDDARKAYLQRCKDANRVRRSKPGVSEADLRLQHLKYKEDGHYRRRKILRQWCSTYSWLREQLPWKTHQPIYYSQQVEHFCYGCKWTRTSGAKLWCVIT
jgi:hypothetical protein